MLYKPIHVSFHFCFSFTVENLYREGAYLLSANISQCYEANQDCAINHVLFTNSLLPKSVCNWSSDYKIASKLTICIITLNDFVFNLFICKTYLSEHMLLSFLMEFLSLVWKMD